MGYFKEWIVKEKESSQFDSTRKEETKETKKNYFPVKDTEQIDSSSNDEKVIKNCPLFVSNIQKSNIKEDTKEKIIHNCFMKDKKDNFIVEKLDSKQLTPKKYVYTDGACIHNGKKYAKAGIGIFFGPNDKRNVSERITGKQTNNAAELEAILMVFEILDKEIKKGEEYVIMTDSEYAIKCMKSYGYKLALKNWKTDKPIPNIEKVKAGFLLFQNYPNVKLEHVRAHTGKKDAHSIGNEWADKLATASIQTHHTDTSAY
jgi:ribonuclease HI